jgi:pimeloyl-ACP methyl ester carboxylesterase
MDGTGRQIDVGGRSLFLRCRGRGSPTVVLETGTGWGSDAWDAVLEPVAEFTHVCCYDRAGVGRSEPIPGPRTAQDVVADLQALLLTAGVAAPYVLVGHSFGGFVARLFAHAYPDAVVGMVLVDVPHPEYPRRALALMPPAAADDCEELREARDFFTQLVRGTDDPATHPERIRFGVSLAQVAAAGALGSLPLVVLTAGRVEPYSADFPADLGARLDRLREAQQEELVGLSASGQHMIAARSGHMIQQDQPELVIEAIHRVVEAARRGRTPGGKAS